MKKKLHTDAIQNELSEGSVFFQGKSKQAPAPDAPTEPPATKPTRPRTHAPPQATQHLSNESSNQASMHASTLANKDALIETIRKTVKQIGKETTFIRLTPDEKRQLRAIDYTYKSHGIKTSENEIGRIGINFLLEDYKAHGEASILARVLAALNA